jgi:hypothetical protein
LDASNTGKLDKGAIWLRGADASDWFPVVDVWDDATDKPNLPLAVQVVPGNYDIRYSVEKDGPHWPSNIDALLKPAVAMTMDGALSVNVPVVDLKLNVTLDGAPVIDANTGKPDRGAIWMHDRATKATERFLLVDVWDEAAGKLNIPHDVQVVPGTYELRYTVVNDGAHWPSNVDAPLGKCLTLQ